MSSWRERSGLSGWRVGRAAAGRVAALVLLGMAAMAGIHGAAHAQSGTQFPGIGRAATAQEIKAWDIDVRPDFKGLPPGSGSVKKGQEVWEAKCASCHGVFGESTQFFHPLVGGTTAQDIKSGRVARLQDRAYPSRTTMMKLASLSTLWDYIHRAMPWTEPKSLSADEVYAVTGYMLHMAGLVPENFTLSDQNIRQTQALMPNRNGMSTAHALWPGKGLAGQRAKPDVLGSACMKDCPAPPKIASSLPDYARDAHGNLAEQQRIVGPQRGADTRRVEAKTMSSGEAPAAASKPAPQATTASTPSAPVDGRAAQALARQHRCTACHAASSKLLGPSWADIAAKYAGKADYLAGIIKSGSSGLWGAVPMPPQALAEADARVIANWLAAGATK